MLLTGTALASSVTDAGRQEAADRTRDKTSSWPVDLPADLVQELGRLLGEALAADIREYPNLAGFQASRVSTVESPPGFNRPATRQPRHPHAGRGEEASGMRGY